MTIKYCEKCVTPNTRPRIEFDKEGVCNACRHEEWKDTVDWEKKREELRKLTAQYRNKNNYDCIIPVSGGKDSHYQVWYLKEFLGLNPLCVTFAPSIPNKLGQQNLRNLIEEFNVDHVMITPNPIIHANLCDKMLEQHGNIFIPWVQGIFSAVTQEAIRRKIPLIIYGENGEAEYGGSTKLKALSNKGIAERIRTARSNWRPPEEWHKYGYLKENLLPYIMPSQAEQKRAGIRRIYLGDYDRWNTAKHLELAYKWDFKDRKDRSPATYTTGASIDDDIDQIYMWFMWLKFGIGRASKSASPDIREKTITRKKGIRMAKLYDHEFPWETFHTVLQYICMTEGEFWKIAKRFVNPKVWKKVGKDKWQHRNTIHGEDRFLELPVKR